MADKININTAIFVHERDENHLYVIGIGQNWKNSGYTQYYIQQPLQPNREKTTERKLFKNIIKCYNCIFRFVNQNLLHSIR